MKIIIINYGAGNIQSIKFAVQRLGFQAELSSSRDEILAADKVIFPGVGQASSAMQKLKQAKLDELIPSLKQPVLGICLGMQLLCDSSEEGDTSGLGIFNTKVCKFNLSAKVPQIGWNCIYHLSSPLFFGVSENEYVYLVHSYYAPLTPETIAKTKYGGVEYSTAMCKSNFYGTQFHPEKSGSIGQTILANFLKIPAIKT